MTRGYLSEIFVSFQGEGAHVGRRQLFVRLAGCNLRCTYCDTPDSLQHTPTYRVFGPAGAFRTEANPVTPDTALAQALSVLDGDAVDGMAITGGEPLTQPGFLAELLADERLPHPRLLETNGMLPQSLAAVLPHVDVVSMDIKLPSNSGERAFWDQHEQFLRQVRGKAYVKVLVDAGTAMADVSRAASLVRGTAPEAPLFLQPITAADGQVGITASALNEFFITARRCVQDVRVVPQTHKMLAIL
ncbi:MAG: 7-carboxy-7-deazaguanine synthase QueE [Candidatus Binatia bacterium]